MTSVSIRGNVAALTVLTCLYASATGPAIGFASARGSIRINGSLINSNATLFDGTLIETDKATTALRVDKGVELKLGTDSRGKVFRDRLVLEKGASEFTSLGKFRLEASTLKISADDPSSRGVIKMKDAQSVEVSALTGGFQVTTQRGLLLAKIRPGHAVAFDMGQAGVAAQTKITGTLSKKEGAYFVTVPETGVVYEVTGKNLNSFVGKKVIVTGTPDPKAHPQGIAAAVIIVSSTTVVGSATGATAAGMAIGTKLIIAGVVIAGVAGTSVGIYEAQKGSAPASAPGL